jgi:BASS family bile acid:Na+ symporter
MGNIDDFVMVFSTELQLWLVATLFAMMFAVALNLSVSSFRFFRTAPRLYLAGLFSQLIALPAVTILLCYLLQPPPTIALGMIIVACCPGGASSNLITLYARGNVALSVALTATSSLLAAVLTPISILFWARGYGPSSELLTSIDVDVISFLIETALILALPIALGMLVNWKAPNWSARWRNRVAIAAGMSLLLFILYTSYLYFEDFWALGLGIAGLTWIHNFTALGTGFGIGTLVRADSASRRSLTIETGIQNTGLALVILLTQFAGPGMAMGGAVAIVGLYGTYHLVSGTLIAWIWRRFGQAGVEAAHV